jgi:hypothetical protein
MSAPVKLFIADDYLTRDDRTSPVWARLKDRLEKKLEALRKANDNPKLTDVETATLRGHLKCLKEVIALGNEPPESVAPDARPRPRIDLGAKYG